MAWHFTLNIELNTELELKLDFELETDPSAFPSSSLPLYESENIKQVNEDSPQKKGTILLFVEQTHIHAYLCHLVEKESKVNYENYKEFHSGHIYNIFVQ